MTVLSNDAGAGATKAGATKAGATRDSTEQSIGAEVWGVIMAASRHAICVTDTMLDEPGPRIEYVNPAYLDMFCCERDDCIGRSPRFAQGPLTSRTVLDHVRAGLERGEVVYAQTINYRLDGEPFRVRWSIDPVRDGAGRVIRYVAVLADVTYEDRLRRRLLALDALTTSLRQVSGPPDAASAAVWMVDALTPLIDELGSVRVSLGPTGRRHTASHAATSGIESHREIPLATMPVGRHGHVAVSAHPDATDMIDVAAIEPLCEQLAWSIDQAGGFSDAGRDGVDGVDGVDGRDGGVSRPV